MASSRKSTRKSGFYFCGAVTFFSNRGLGMKEPVSCLLSKPNRTGVVWSPEESGLGFLIAQREVAEKSVLKFGPLSQ